MTGQEWTDQVCINESACVEDFEFFLVEDSDNAWNLDAALDGIVGLARNYPHLLTKEKGNRRGPSIMMAMENAKIITDDSFSFFMRPAGKDSYFDFGKPKTSRMRDSDDLAWFDVQEDFFWSAYCKGFAIGDITNGWSWGSVKGEKELLKKNSIYTMFDTASSQIILPQAYFPAFLEELFRNMADKEYELADGYVVSKCYDDFPNVQFLFDGHWIDVEPRDYVVDVSSTGKPGDEACVLLFGQGDHPYVVMGLPAYMDYYVVHDDDNSRIGFAPHNYSKKDAPIAGKQPDRIFMSSTPSEKDTSIWTWIVCSILILAFPAFWVTAIYRAGMKDTTPGQRGGREFDMDTTTLVIWICIAVASWAVWTWLIVWFFWPWFNDAIVDDARASLEQKMLVAGSAIGVAAYLLKDKKSEN